MNIKYIRVFYALLLLIYLMPITVFAADDVDLADDLASYDEPDIHISDPLEPLNRVIFKFNDKVYFYLLKPVAKTWSFIVPQEIRASLWSAFQNLLMPVRVVNDLFQGRIYESGIEVSRFVLNSTVGVAGLGDPAKYVFKLESSDEDFGQTIGAYGAGEGMYLYLPFFGPSNLRDTVGLVGDSFLDPLNYMTSDWKGTAALHTGKRVNHTSLNIGEYEQFKEEAFDPYVAMREFYTKYRRKKIANRLINWRLAGGTNKKVAMVKVQDESLVKTPEPSAHEDEQRYYVQVGVFFDRDSMSDMNLKLASVGEKAVVATYQRDDYAFYGLQVPAGSSFEAAKRVEGEIVSKGFTETTVLRRAASSTPSSLF
jgi:phospholipid-binding lipoprotein MlaA